MSCLLQYYAKCCQYLAGRPATESLKQVTIHRCLPWKRDPQFVTGRSPSQALAWPIHRTRILLAIDRQIRWCLQFARLPSRDLGENSSIELHKLDPFARGGPPSLESVWKQPRIKDYLEEALQKNWIRPSRSEANATIFFMPIMDKGLRLCRR
jgi:hypothetical protein